MIICTHTTINKLLAVNVLVSTKHEVNTKFSRTIQQSWYNYYECKYDLWIFN